jgi:hypothetical protein
MRRSTSANPQKQKESLERGSSLNQIDFAIIFQAVLIALFLMHFMALTWYFGIEYNPRISWVSVDGNWPEEFRFGNHFFGDYYQVWLMAKESAWNQTNIYPPFGTALFKIFGIFPYKIGLLFYLILIAICVLVPLISATSRRGFSERTTTVLIFGVFSVPFISIIDRGNNLGLIIPLIYFSIIYSKSSSNKSGILLGIASAIKVYPILLSFLLPTKNRMKLILTTLTTSLGLNFLAAFIWGNPFEIARRILVAQSSFSNLPATGDPMIFSAAAFTLNVSNYIFGVNSTVSNFILNNQRGISISIVVLSLIGTRLATGLGKEILIVFFALYTLQLAPITSYSYTRWWSLVVIALLFNDRFKDKKSIGVDEAIIWTACLLNIALIKFNALNPISMFPTISYLLFLALLTKVIVTGLAPVIRRVNSSQVK